VLADSSIRRVRVNSLRFQVSNLTTARDIDKDDF
jgi:hypothetical protein